MKAEQLKQFIKPLIKECLKEVLIEEGLVQTINEIKKTVMPSEIIGGNVSIKQTAMQQLKAANQQAKQDAAAEKLALQEAKKKMLDAIGQGGFDAFKGTQPLQEDVQVKATDPGVDISKLMNNNRGTWNQILQGMEGKKR